MEKRVIEILIAMGMSPSIKGFKYIVDAISIFEECGNPVIIYLYDKIAQRNGDERRRVERAIRHAFSCVLKNGENGTVKKYLLCENKTNGNLLATLYYRVKAEVE